METKHTPGPWIYGTARDSEGRAARITAVAHCCDYVIGLESDYEGGNYRDGDPEGDPEADARLIAAAPELLGALQVAELMLRERGLGMTAEYKQIADALTTAVWREF